MALSTPLLGTRERLQATCSAMGAGYRLSPLSRTVTFWWAEAPAPSPDSNLRDTVRTAVWIRVSVWQGGQRSTSLARAMAWWNSLYSRTEKSWLGATRL